MSIRPFAGKKPIQAKPAQTLDQPTADKAAAVVPVTSDEIPDFYRVDMKTQPVPPINTRPFRCMSKR